MPRKIKDDNIFFGLQLTDEQKEYRDSIYSGNYDIIFCNAKAGTGKTTIAVATSKLLVAEGQFDGLVYIVAPVQERSLGYLPGDVDEKIAPYSEPLVQALVKINENEKSIKQMTDPSKFKSGEAWVDCVSHTYMRGINLEKKIIIVDEMQNMYTDEAKKVITRVCSNSRIICIGHTGQVDLYKNKENSGFAKYIEHFRGQERCKICELTHNFRGWVSTHADELT